VTVLEQLVPGLWTWTADHPDWEGPESNWDAAVRGYLAFADDATLLVDPPLEPPEHPAGAQGRSELGALVHKRGRPVAIFVTIPWHLRSSAELVELFDATAYSHPKLGPRLAKAGEWRELRPGGSYPGGVAAHPIGNPRTRETPLFLSSHRALVVGDTIVEARGTGAPRLWAAVDPKPGSRVWYEKRYVPSFRPLLELPVKHLLLTHGRPVLDRGHDALREALESPPVARMSE
jgi:hypothetical protein